MTIFDAFCTFGGTFHYSDVIMSAIASQIAGVSIVDFSVCSDEDQRKHQSSVSLAFVRVIHRWAVNCPSKRASSNAGNVSSWWRHHVIFCISGDDVSIMSTVAFRWFELCLGIPNTPQFTQYPFSATYPPKIFLESQHPEIAYKDRRYYLPGEPVVLPCVAEGDPTPT